MSIEAYSSSDDLDILGQFNNASYDVLNAVMARTAGERIHPALDGKPINLMQFYIERPRVATAGEFDPSPIERESLRVFVQRAIHLRLHANDPLFRQLSSEEKQEQHAVVAAAGQARLKQNFPFNHEVPPQATWAGYTAHRLQRPGAPSSDLIVSTYEPPRIEDAFERLHALSSALFFARDALAYIISSDFERPDHRKDRHEMKHRLNLLLIPELGWYLNGHESTPFLKVYQERMRIQYKNACDIMDNFEKMNQAPDAAAKLKHKQCQYALESVNEILAERE